MIRASQRHRSLVCMTAHGAIAVAVALSAVGCKSGGTWAAKPSWWAFGGGDEASKLASAPPAPGDVTKPSAAAKPYPTTTTPEGYVLANARGDGQPASAASPQAAEPAVVTYGSTPPAPAATVAGATAAPAAAGGLSSITPQVGPYASAPPVDTTPSAASSYASTTSAFAPGNAAATAGGLQGGSAFGGAATAPADPRLDPAGTRVADARASESWSSPTASAAGDSRYGTATGSRFSGGAPAAAAVLPATGGSLPAELPAAPPVQPGTIAPPTPTRRPDPGYRPGGTSSYRPSRTILAAGSADDGGVSPASFDADASVAP